MELPVSVFAMQACVNRDLLEHLKQQMQENRPDKSYMSYIPNGPC